MGVSGIHFKHTDSLFQPHYSKETNTKYALKNKLMLKSPSTEGTEPAVKVVT